MKDLVVITGGGSGLGFELAKKFAKKGFVIYLVDLNSEKLYFANKYLRENFHATVYSFCGNVSDEQFIKKIFLNIDTEKIELKYLINSAGQGSFCNIEDVTLDTINKNLEGNLIGVILTCTSAIKLMNEKGGKIINILSTSAIKPDTSEAVYCASKYGAKGYTDSLRQYTKDSNINVVSVYPSKMKTDFWNNECRKFPNTSSYMKPECVADKIFDIVSDDSINISEIVIEKNN